MHWFGNVDSRSYASYTWQREKEKEDGCFTCIHVIHKLTGGPSAPGIPGKPGFPVGPYTEEGKLRKKHKQSEVRGIIKVLRVYSHASCSVRLYKALY